MKKESMLGKWNYHPKGSVCYSDSKQESYKKSAEFLGDTVEDWGCGTGWSKNYFKNYRGIDGSYHPNVDEIVDLVDYTSDVDNILIRQVLELNIEWKKIIENLKKSFKKKLCIIIFTPTGDTTHIIEYGSNSSIPVISFKKEDILDCFSEEEFIILEETIETGQGYNKDWIIYIERR